MPQPNEEATIANTQMEQVALLHSMRVYRQSTDLTESCMNSAALLVATTARSIADQIEACKTPEQLLHLVTALKGE